MRYVLILFLVACGDEFPIVTASFPVSGMDQGKIRAAADFASDQIDAYFSNQYLGPFNLAGTTQITLGSPSEIQTWCKANDPVAGCVVTPWRIVINQEEELCKIVMHEYFHIAFYRAFHDFDGQHQRLSPDYYTVTQQLCVGHETYL